MDSDKNIGCLYQDSVYLRLLQSKPPLLDDERGEP